MPEAVGSCGSGPCPWLSWRPILQAPQQRLYTGERPLRQFQEGGVERLKRLDLAVPESELADHRETLEEHFRKNPPRSAAQAADDIERLTGIRRGPTQVRKFLAGMGMKFGKLGMIPAKADADEQAEFLDEKLWPRLKQAQRLKRVACFVDAAHFVHGPYLGYLWCFARLLMRGPSGRKRFNVLGAIDAVTHELTTVCNQTTINAQAICESLGKLSARYMGLPITPVLDNARYQKCAMVQRLAASLKIELLFRPPYSPNLNLIERLWKFVVKECLSCRYHEDFSRFKAAIVDCLRESRVSTRRRSGRSSRSDSRSSTILRSWPREVYLEGSVPGPSRTRCTGCRT